MYKKMIELKHNLVINHPLIDKIIQNIIKYLLKIIVDH